MWRSRSWPAQAGNVFFSPAASWSSCRLREMTALVKASSKKSQTVPAWAGGQLAAPPICSPATCAARWHRCAAAHGTGGIPANSGLDSASYDGPSNGAAARRPTSLRLPRQDPSFPGRTCPQRRWQPLFAFPSEGQLRARRAGPFSVCWPLDAHQAEHHRGRWNTTALRAAGTPRLPLRGVGGVHSEELLDGASLQAIWKPRSSLELCRPSLPPRHRPRWRAWVVKRLFPGQSQERAPTARSRAALLLWYVFERHEPGKPFAEQARRE